MKKIFTAQRAGSTIEFTVGVVLLTAATAKLVTLGDLVFYIQSIPWLPHSATFASGLAAAVIALEATFGVICIQGLASRRIKLAVLALFTAFLLWQILLLFPFMGAVPKACPCFGNIDEAFGLNHYYPLIRDVIFCLMAIGALKLGKERPSPEATA